jgi:hypothetical protein
MSETLLDVTVLGVGITLALLFALAVKRFNARKAGLLCRRLFKALWLPLGIVTSLAIWAGVYHCFPHYDPVRLEAWNKVEPRITQTHQETKREADKTTAKVKAFFAERKRYARSFASELLSLGGKWAYLKGYFSEGSHELYVQECFSRNIFSGDQLKTLIESEVASYVSEIQGRENQLLVAIRADLESSELAAPQYLPALGSEEQFRREYEAMIAEVLPVLSKDLGMTVTREVASMVGSEIATTLLTEIGVSVASELGISGGVLTLTATSAVFTLGIGILVDMILDWAIRQAGYDPEGQIAAKVVESLDQLERIILEGGSKTKQRYEDAQSDWTWSLPWSDSKAGSTELQTIESGGGLGLNHQLHHINDIRSRLREEALKGLILKGGAQ